MMQAKNEAKDKETACLCKHAVNFFGGPGRIRTCDLLIRSQTLYPAELRSHDLTNDIIYAGELIVNNEQLSFLTLKCRQICA